MYEDDYDDDYEHEGYNTDYGYEDVDEDIGYEQEEDDVFDFQEEEQEFKATFKQIQEQLGTGKIIGTEVFGDNDIAKLQAKLLEEKVSDEIIFKRSVQVAINSYSNKLKLYKIGDFNDINKVIDGIPNVIRLNANAFTLGYYVLSKGGEIYKLKVDDVYNNALEGLAKPDIIRYARFLKRYK